MNKINKKGFTLTESLVAIGIIVVIVTIAVLIFNPTELIARFRDTQRLSDLSQLNSAVALYLSKVEGSYLGDPAKCYTHVAAAEGCGGRHPGKATEYNPFYAVDGTGWLPVDLTKIPSGPPVVSLPVDPTSTLTGCDPTGSGIVGCFYTYVVGSYEFTANMESAYYSNGGGNDVESKDGGNNHNLYQKGSQLNIDGQFQGS